MKNFYKIARILIVVATLAGLVTMGYLVNLHFSDSEGASFCNLGEGLSCDIVNKSEYSKVLGIPVSILGFIYFLAVFAAALFRYDKNTLKAIAFVSIVFLGPSLYLTGTELFVIKSICVLCEFSKALMLALVLISIFALKPEKFSQQTLITAIVLAFLMAMSFYFLQSITFGGVEEGTYDEFAQCLYEEGMRMYGSATCQFCAKQRKEFGNAFEFINEIECDPRNPGSEAKRCIDKNIKHTPTWILEDDLGNDLVRFEPGLVSFDELSEVTGCEYPAGE